MKLCTKCFQVKDLEEFALNRKTNLRQSWCRECHREYMRQRHVKLQAEGNILYLATKRSNAQNNNAVKKGITGKLTAQFLVDLFETQQHKCAYCDCICTWLEIQIDHKVPYHVGGTNEESNIALACKPCNTQKLVLPLEDFLRTRHIIKEVKEGKYGSK